MTDQEAVDFEVFERALEEAARRDAKRRKRAALKKLQGTLSGEYTKEADAGIAAAVLQSEAFETAQTVFCYVSVKGEPDTAVVIDEALRRGKQVAVPRCLGKGVMEAVLIAGREDLANTGKYGIPEPREGLAVLEPDQFDLLIIPCVACTRERARLGHGMGYYDRFMEQAGGTSMALCYERLLQERLPEEPHDRRPDQVISEETVYAGPEQ